MEVTLNPAELEIARLVGQARYGEAIERDWQPVLGFSTVEAHIDGAIGEIAVAKALDRWWTGLERLAPTDVGPYHVRFTRYRDGHLIIRPGRDPDTGPFVLVTGDPDRSTAVEIAGGMKAEDAARRYPLRDPGDRDKPCRMIPRDDLLRLAVAGHNFCAISENAGRIPPGGDV